MLYLSSCVRIDLCSLYIYFLSRIALKYLFLSFILILSSPRHDSPSPLKRLRTVQRSAAAAATSGARFASPITCLCSGKGLWTLMLSSRTMYTKDYFAVSGFEKLDLTFSSPTQTSLRPPNLNIVLENRPYGLWVGSAAARFHVCSGKESYPAAGRNSCKGQSCIRPFRILSLRCLADCGVVVGTLPRASASRPQPSRLPPPSGSG